MQNILFHWKPSISDSRQLKPVTLSQTILLMQALEGCCQLRLDVPLPDLAHALFYVTRNLSKVVTFSVHSSKLVQ